MSQALDRLSKAERRGRTPLLIPQYSLQMLRTWQIRVGVLSAILLPGLVEYVVHWRVEIETRVVNPFTLKHNSQTQVRQGRIRYLDS